MLKQKDKKIWPLSYQAVLNDFSSMPQTLEKCMDFYLNKEGKDILLKVKELLKSINFSRVLFIGNSFNYYASFSPIYSLMSTSNGIDFYFDKTNYFTFYIEDADPGKDNRFRKPFYLLINLALGGSWGGPIDDSVLPQKYLIDYVRVYELAAK